MDFVGFDGLCGCICVDFVVGLDCGYFVVDVIYFVFVYLDDFVFVEELDYG